MIYNNRVIFRVILMVSAFVIKGGMLIDGTGKEPVQNSAVVISGDRIFSVGRSNEIEYPKGESPKVIDASGSIVMPGLIDAHTHVSFAPYGDVADLSKGSAEQLTLWGVKNARSYLYAGFTTIRDVATRGDVAICLRDAINSDMIEGPRIVTARKFIFPTGGGVEYTSHTHPPELAYSRRADGPDAVITAVREDVRAGADLIKMEATGACDSLTCFSDRQTYSFEEMKAATTEAHRLGRRVAFHAEGAEGAKTAIKAGADTIEHGFFLDKEALNLIKERGLTLEPTIGMIGTRLEKEWSSVLPKSQVEGSRRAFEACRETLRSAREIGVKVALGSDSGAFHYPHGTSARELEYMVDFGFSEMECIVSGTKIAAEASGLGNLGTLEQGKIADVLIIKGNPLQDIKVLQNTDAISVMKDGKPVKGF